MKNLILIITIIFLSSCSSLTPLSFWDDNQSASIINVRQSIENLDCDYPHAPQVLIIKNNLQWFDLYSESKGSRQQDVRKLIAPMSETVDDFYARSISAKQGSTFYCNSKKQILQEQSDRAARAVMRRF